MNDQVNNAASTESTEQARKAQLSGMYAEPVKAIARNARALDKARGGIWAGFRAALPIAVEHAHNAEAMREGLSLACADASVPAGTVRSYLPTLEKLLADVQDEANPLTLEACAEMSIQDARKRYAQPKAPKAANGGGGEGGDPESEQSERSKLLSRLNTAIGKLNDAELLLLVDLAEEQAGIEAQPEAEGSDDAEGEETEQVAKAA